MLYLSSFLNLSVNNCTNVCSLHSWPPSTLIRCECFVEYCVKYVEYYDVKINMVYELKYQNFHMIWLCMKYLFYDLAYLLLDECYMLNNIVDWNQTIWHQRQIFFFKTKSSKTICNRYWYQWLAGCCQDCYDGKVCRSLLFVYTWPTIAGEKSSI